MRNKTLKNQGGFAHPLAFLLFIVVIVVIGFAGYRIMHRNRTDVHGPVNMASNQGDPNSTDPIAKGKALGSTECTGQGTVPLTHAVMDMKDVDYIQPYGYMAAAHVTPIDHQYYFQVNLNAPANTYPVYATADGKILAVQHQGDTYYVVLSHTCTFFSWYNLLTGLAPDIQAKVSTGSGPTSMVNIPVKAGQLIGYVGGSRALDFAVWNTEKTLPGFLYPVAYNNEEPWKINTAQPLDYYTADVKTQVLSKYIRTVQPLDGKIDYDVSGQAVGNWFATGTNGDAGDGTHNVSTFTKGHLSLSYDAMDPAALTFSTGDYQGQPAQFAIKGSTDWTKITPNSGVAKVELANRTYYTSTGALWQQNYVKGGLTMKPSTDTVATALIQLTGKDELKLEIFPGKTPAQVSGFDSAAKTYDRGQNAHM